MLLYGCGTLLIREAKARWKLGWSVILLAIAYSIIEEVNSDPAREILAVGIISLVLLIIWRRIVLRRRVINLL